MEIPTGPSIMDLPTPIVVDILLHLSVGKILICKCVCKAWREIILDPQFTKLYRESADVYVLIRPIISLHVSRTLYLINSRCHGLFDASNKIILKTKFKIHMCNYERALEIENSLILAQGEHGKKRKCLELNSYDYKFDIENSCNGFLCLSKKDIAVVSNPVTGEYVNIPTPIVFENEKPFIRYGLGFSPRTNNYKVIRIFGRNAENWVKQYGPLTGYQNWFSSYAQIQTMGSRSWKHIGLAPFCSSLNFATYVNGTLNWLVDGNLLGLSFIAYFDFDNDLFGLFSLPPGSTRLGMRLGLLRDHLCYSFIEVDVLHIWEMNEYGVEGSWTKVCNLLLSENLASGNINFAPHCRGFYQPIARLEDGTIVLLYGNKKLGVTYYEPTNQRRKYLRVQGIKAPKFEAVYYTPSFILLKDVLVDDDVEAMFEYAKASLKRFLEIFTKA